MLASWVIEEMENVDLADQRLNERMAIILDQLAGRPTASIPAACGGYAETMAAYRFFDNEKVDFDNILEPHIEATYRRIAEHPLVILVQDTTEIDLTRVEQQVVGAGPLDGAERRGCFLHPLIAFTPDGTPLGTVCAEAWTRDEQEALPKPERENQRKHTPIEEKESIRWVETYREALRPAKQLPQTQFVAVADSEADIYEMLEQSREELPNSNWIVRACQNRAIVNDQENGAKHLREQVITGDVLFTQTIHVRGRKAKVSCENRGRRQPRESRTTNVEVRAMRVTLRAPWRHDRKLADISVNVVLVTEINPPKDDIAVEWMLLTSLPIDNVDEVRTVIQYYCVRWMIEVFFRTLKSGCRVEDRRFEHIDRFFPCLAVYLIVTWRTLFVCRLSREFPEISCEAVFEPAEWKSVYCIIHKQRPPKRPPTLREMLRLVAQLGGYVNRKRPDEPGPQTVWLGLQRMHDIATCWLTFGPESNRRDALV